MEFLEELIFILEESLEVEISEIDEDTLIENLHLSPSRLERFLFYINEEFSLDIQKKEFDRFDTISDIINIIPN